MGTESRKVLVQFLLNCFFPRAGMEAAVCVQYLVYLLDLWSSPRPTPSIYPSEKTSISPTIQSKKRMFEENNNNENNEPPYLQNFAMFRSEIFSKIRKSKTEHSIRVWLVLATFYFKQNWHPFIKSRGSNALVCYWSVHTVNTFLGL